MINDACLGLAKSVYGFYPDVKWQRCIVHFYCNVFSVVPRGKVKHVAMMLKTIHASEDREVAQEKARAVIKKLEAQKLRQAVEKVKENIHETLTYYDFPSAHWRRIRTNNPLKRILREVRRRTRGVGAFFLARRQLRLDAGCSSLASHCRHWLGNQTLSQYATAK